MTDFISELSLLLKKSWENNYSTDHIPYISNALQYSPQKKTFKQFRKELIKRVSSFWKVTLQSKINNKLKKYDIAGLSKTYELLNDEYSRKLFIILIAHRILGPSKVRLPLADKSFWQQIPEIDNKCKKGEQYNTKQWTLDLLDLNPIGYNIKYFLKAEGIFISFYLKQYDYDKNGVFFKVEKDDYVIDGGACFGDTALQFAEAVGEKGKVFSFEFIQDNITLFKKNLELNPELEKRITLHEFALWSNSSDNLYVVELGAASFATVKKPSHYLQRTPTKTIDDFVDEHNLHKINFIKLDIEGAELECLKGASKTIKKFKPKLAICLYHNKDHFVSIPQYVKKLVPQYKLYIDHHSANLGETVMYAINSGN